MAERSEQGQISWVATELLKCSLKKRLRDKQVHNILKMSPIKTKKPHKTMNTTDEEEQNCLLSANPIRAAVKMNIYVGHMGKEM